MSDRFAHRTDKTVLATAIRLIEWKKTEANLKRLAARDAVAAEAKLPPGALRRLFDGSLKDTTRVGRALDDLLIRKAERQMAAIAAEVSLARARRDGDRPIDVVAVEAALAEVRRLLARRPPEDVK